MDIWCLIANCPSIEVAEAIGRAALERGLAKNVNISAPMKTMYLWNGKIVDNQEVQLIFKISERELEGLTALVRARHPFETASIIAWRIDHTTPDYDGFIRAT